jgi:NAD(P)-dependent dehydrogenase (short-subunit alcohol dehydrogenase family)
MKTLIIGASGGIGSALCRTLQARDETVIGVSRSTDGLDVTDEASVVAHLNALNGPFDRILIVTGALEIDGQGPEKALRQLGAEAMLVQYQLNAIGPALVIKHAVPLLPRDRPALIAALSARVGSIGDNRAGGWYSYRASKAALNQLIRCAAIEIRRTHPQSICVALHPGTVDTPLTRRYRGNHPAVAADEAAQNLLRVMDGLTSKHTGGFFDWAGKAVPW